MKSIYWYTHRWQFVFSIIVLITIVILVALAFIPKPNSQKYYEGFVIAYHYDHLSESNLGTESLVLTVDIQGGAKKFVRGSHYHVNTTVKISCINTYLFNSETCHIVLDLK